MMHDSALCFISSSWFWIFSSLRPTMAHSQTFLRHQKLPLISQKSICLFKHVNITVNSRLKIYQRFSPLSHSRPYKGFIFPMIEVSDVILICCAKLSKGFVSGCDWQHCLMRALTPELKHWLKARTKINQEHLGMTSSARFSITIAVRGLVR